jgi:hypothetical protein
LADPGDETIIEMEDVSPAGKSAELAVPPNIFGTNSIQQIQV